MARSLTKVTNQSSGIYFNEIDLTFAQENAGTFAGGAIITAPKGPAFEVITSTGMGQRRTNYKEIRILGLEGYSYSDYSESGATGYALLYRVAGSSPQILGEQTELTISSVTQANPAVVTTSTAHGYSDGDRVQIADAEDMTEINGNWIISVVDSTKFIIVGLNTATADPYGGSGTVIRIITPLTAAAESVAAILKPRKTNFTGLDAIYSVEVDLYTDPVSDEESATDDKFVLKINFGDSEEITSTTEVICSLRPTAKEYIGKIFGTDPLDLTKLQGNKSPLWVEYVIPSVATRLHADDTETYYYPGETDPENSYSKLDLVTGTIGFDTSFAYENTTITAATNASTIVVTAAGHYLRNDDIVSISGVTGNTNANGVRMVKNATSTTFELYDIDGITPIAGNAAYVSGGVVKIKYTPTWETEVSNFADTQFTTPVTPWFVSDIDANLEVKKLFRLHSISDGVGANTEIKVEISNIDPTAKNGYGQFDIFIRDFTDREDIERKIYDSYTGVTLNPLDDDYILRRIGDGEEFPIQSEWIFVEMSDEILEGNELPYGVEGYSNTTGLVFPEVIWTTEYDLSKPIRKQYLGLANNRINMFKSIGADQLKYRSVSGAASTSKGFHLNEEASSADFVTAPIILEDQLDSLGDPKSQFVTNPTINKGNLKYVVAFAGGFDGWNLYKERTFDTTTSKDFEAIEMAIEKLNDKEDLLVDFSVLVAPVAYRQTDGSLNVINMQDHTNVCERINEMVIARGDAMFIPDFPYDVESSPETASDTIKFKAQNLRNSFNASYYPWIQITDSDNKVNPWVPASYLALATIAATATNEDVWQPPAGSLRTVTDKLIRTRKRMKLADREILKAVNINAITNFPGSGFEITESRTLQEQFSALSFIHNRLLLGYAKKALNQVLRPLLHQLKGEITDSAFVNVVTPIFERIKKKNGLAKYTINVVAPQGNTPDDRVTLRGQVVIYPLYPIEKIVVDFILKDDDFTVTQG